MFDILLRGGTVIDGTGRAAFSADVAIEKDRIAAVGHLPDAAARQTVDCTGLTVTPGFIDIHRHADGAVFRPGFGAWELCQGLTTIVNGNCGLSAAPFGPDNAAAIRAYLQPITGTLPAALDSGSLAGYFRSLPPLPVNAGMLVGAGTLRADAAGYELTELTDGHFSAIHRAMEQALADGALGVSLGLGYAPECFYSTSDLIRALQPVAGTKIPVTVHMRQEGGGVVASVQEMITVARALGCPVHISHLKAMGRDNWGSKIPQVLSLLEQARSECFAVDCDVYPYTAGSTQLLHILPPDFLTGGMEAVVARLRDKETRKELAARIESGAGFDDIAKLAGWDGIYLTSLHCPEDHPYQGKNLMEIAALMGQDPLTVCCELLVREHGQITMIDFMASEEDICAILRSPLSCVISDATYPTEGQLHPRVCGNVTHLLEHFVREKGALSWESAVHKLTEKPAEVLGLKGKGRLAAGYDADVCVFAPEALHERAGYTDPRELSAGMTHVLVNGVFAIRDGALTGETGGKVIKAS